MITKNKKVERLLAALAVVVKDEEDELIKKMHDVIRDNKPPAKLCDGYDYNFIAMVNGVRTMVKGKSY